MAASRFKRASRAPDLAHAAPAQQFHDLEVAYSFAPALSARPTNLEMSGAFRSA